MNDRSVSCPAVTVKRSRVDRSLRIRYLFTTMAGPSPRQGLGRTTVWRRAQELKREILRPTIKLPEGRASSYEQSMWQGGRTYGDRRRGGVFLPFCIALLLGALSMTIPVSGTFLLQGTLLANAEPAANAVPVLPALPALPVGAAAANTETATNAATAAPAPAAPLTVNAVQVPEGTAGRAVVFAQPAECPWAQLDEPSIVTIDIPGQSDLVLSANILSIEEHARGVSDQPQPACRVELALIPEGEEAVVLRGLPLGAAARAEFPTTRSWIGAIVAQLPTDSRQAIDKASAGFRVVNAFVRQQYRTYFGPQSH